MGFVMIVGGAIWNVMAALTPKERWDAARGLNSRSAAGGALDPWFLILAIAALVFLLGLLWHVSKKRRMTPGSLSRELFAENAVRRGLSVRERQILLAIAMRSRLVRSHEIFTTAEAFDRGTAKLLAECLQTRTPDENEQLKIEVVSLREKLGFQVLQNGAGPVHCRSTSSRDIPIGGILELTRRRERSGQAIQARVVRNDDIELAVDLAEPVEAHGSDAWRVRYSFGLSVWEFDTTAAGCDDRRLTLNHSEYVRFVNRRRFLRVAVNLPALVAHFPFVRDDACSDAEGRKRMVQIDRRDDAVFDPPTFVQATLVELAGPGLRLEAPLHVHAGDRIIVAFQVTAKTLGENGTDAREKSTRVIESVGQVRHWRSTEQGVSIAVELMGLSGADIDTLVRITNQVGARSALPADAPHRASAKRNPTVVVGSASGQEV